MTTIQAAASVCTGEPLVMAAWSVALLLVTTVQCASLQDNQEATCANKLDLAACRCDEPCARYGDCCRDAPYFVQEEQRPGSSGFACERFNSLDVYTMSSCPPGWKDADTRSRCEHPDASYRDPLLDAPVTSRRTKVTYRNWHCAACHGDLPAGSADVWSVYFSCDNAALDLDDEALLSRLQYDVKTSAWHLNKNPDSIIFEDFGPERCEVGVLPPAAVFVDLRLCDSQVVNTCPQDWADEGVRSQCEAYTSHACLGHTVYRNKHCAACNNNGVPAHSRCVWLDIRIKTDPDFSILLNWRSLRKRDVCHQETEHYDPFSRACRKVFEAGTTVNKEGEDGAKANNSTYELDTCRKFNIEPEYYVLDNDSMVVLVPGYNKSYQPHEYRIENDSQLTICVPLEFEDEEEEEFVSGFNYVTLVGLSMSVFFLIFHLMVFSMTPQLHNLSSMNLASLSMSLLIMYVAFAIISSIEMGSISCVAIAIITQYGMLASFCWMLTIAYDINRMLRYVTKKLLMSTGKHWQRFVLYSLWSWLMPVLVVGATLAAEFVEQVPADLRPGFGTKDCWFYSGDALLIFIVAPLLIVMILNVAFFSWSAYLIHATTSEMRDSSKTYKDFRLYARLALIMGLTWIVGLIAGFVNNEGVWYAFVLLNTLQGLFIFLAFTCTRKVWHTLCRINGSTNKPSHQTRTKTRSTTGTATTST